MTELHTPKEMCFSATGAAEAWRKWEMAFKTYYAAVELSKKEPKTQVAILLHSAGMEAQEIFSNFIFGDNEDKDKVEDVLQKFRQYCEPKENEIFATYKFWSRDRVPGESLERWFNDLKTLAADCNFQEQRERHIRDKIVLSLDDHALRERLIEQGKALTLDKCIDVCRTAETSKARAQTMNIRTKSSSINLIEANRPQERRGQSTVNKQKSNALPRVQRHNCKYCGKQHEPRKCPAYGKECNFCHKLNHFSSVCRNRLMMKSKSDFVRQVRDIQANLYDEDDEFLHISMIQQNGQSTNTKIPLHMLNNKDERRQIMCKLDTGAEANVMASTVYNSLCLNSIRPCKTKLCGFGNSVVHPLGVATIKCSINTTIYLICNFTSLMCLIR